ncbi:MAG: GNAT family N-acetyltransferase [Beijerinckiaceae bacterium]
MSGALADWTPRPFPPRQPIEGRWCRLEPLSVDRHATRLWRFMAGQDEVWRYLPLPPPKDEAEYNAVLAAMVANESIVPLAVIDKADGEPKGHCWIMEIRPAHGVFEIGYITWSPAMQRTPMATEAVYLVGDYGFSLGYRRYEWKCNDRNEPSKRAALRFGFTWEGLFRQHQVVKGENRDTAWYSILDSEWPDRKARFERWLAAGNFDAEGLQKTALLQT